MRRFILLSEAKAVGQTIHLTDPSPHPIEKVYEAMVVELTGKKPIGRLPRNTGGKRTFIDTITKAG